MDIVRDECPGFCAKQDACSRKNAHKAKSLAAKRKRFGKVIHHEQIMRKKTLIAGRKKREITYCRVECMKMINTKASGTRRDDTGVSAAEKVSSRRLTNRSAVKRSFQKDHSLSASFATSGDIARQQSSKKRQKWSEDSASSSGSDLRSRMLEKLKGSQFRWINEKLYSCSSYEAQQWFGNDPALWTAYHEGYQIQVSKWPVDPLDLIIADVRKMPRSYKVADMGCGEARLSQNVAQEVHSFDFCQLNERITPCDICHVPLVDESMDVVIFCLSFMGTNITDLIKEGYRILKNGGLLKIMEILSRFHSVDEFVAAVQSAGFRISRQMQPNKMFISFDFKKVSNPKKTFMHHPGFELKPCLYKKR